MKDGGRTEFYSIYIFKSSRNKRGGEMPIRIRVSFKTF
jgi:hypothetical protein